MITVKKIIGSLEFLLTELLYIISFCFNFIKAFFSCFLRLSSFSALPYRKVVNSNSKVAVLANGPSLKKVLEHYQEYDEFHDTEYMVMNYFCHHPLFKVLKPKYYGMADPMFIKPDDKYDKVVKAFETLNTEVDWDMVLVCPFRRQEFLKYSGLTNPHIKIHCINTPLYHGGSMARHLLYKLGLSHPIFGTVAVLCIFYLLNRGYQNVNVFGVDMTFLEGITINDNNELCTKIKHFYDDKVELKPYIDPSNMKVMKLSKYIDNFGYMLKGHEDMEEYSQRVNSHIINCTEESMLDCYVRRPKIDL